MQEIVIKIPDNYDLSNIKNGSIASQMILNAVKNGTPLPKGYGELVDRNAINERFYSIYNDAINCSNQPSDKYLLDKLSMCLDTAPTIIEADRSEE